MTQSTQSNNRIVLITLCAALAGLALMSIAKIYVASTAVAPDPIPYYADATLTPEFLVRGSSESEGLHRVLPFSLTDQTGSRITEETLSDKISVVNFFFARCTNICPTMRTNLSRVQDAFLEEDDVILISHTVTPEIDTVAFLEYYARLNGVVNNKWHLLTGPKDDIFELARNSYFVNLDTDVSSGFSHSELFVMIDRAGRIRGVYNGTIELEVDRLIEDMEWLLGSASV